MLNILVYADVGHHSLDVPEIVIKIVTDLGDEGPRAVFLFPFEGIEETAKRQESHWNQEQDDIGDEEEKESAAKRPVDVVTQLDQHIRLAP